MKKKKIKACYCYAYWCDASVKLKETFVEVCNELGMKWENNKCRSSRWC